VLTCDAIVSVFPYNLYCVGGDVKHCSIQSSSVLSGWQTNLFIHKSRVWWSRWK